MAGTGIRNWNLARVLAAEHDVTLAAPSGVDIDPPSGATLTSFPDRKRDPEHLGRWQAALVEEHEIIIGQSVPYYECDRDVLAERRIVIDLYAPAILEKLEFARIDEHTGESERRDDVRSLNRLLALGDFFICASERQRDFWLGALAAAGRLSGEHARRDPMFRTLIDVVPFGLPESPPEHTGHGPAATIPGVNEHDPILLWNGGIWNWLDPLTAIRAVASLTEEIPDIRLVFMGVRNPLQRDVEMRTAEQARQLAADLGVLDRHVFFNDWVPFDQRQDWLLESRAAISLHHPTLESRFAFRTRMLDLLWCQVPMIVSAGDVLAEHVQDRGLGIVVQSGAVDETADAIRSVLDPDEHARYAANLRAAADDYTWERASRALLEYCRQPRIIDERRGVDPSAEYIHRLERTYTETAEYARHLESVIEEQSARRDAGTGARLRRIANTLSRGARGILGRNS